MKKKIIIFGAGEWGVMAYYYYMDKCEIVCFCDNSSDLWGEKINGIEICSPQKIKEVDLQQVRIVIANKRRSKQIFEQLYNQFGVSRCIIFKLEINVEEYINEEPCEDSNKNECIVGYMSGLGNQMFQYALAKCLMLKGAYVTGDFSDYYMVGEERKFILDDVFPTIFIKKCNSKLKNQYKNDIFTHITEQSVLSVDRKEADMSILEIKQGYFEGYWQSYQYVEFAEKELRKDFRFAYGNEEKLILLSKMITRMEKTVSVHIRRGDYLEGNNKKHFGNICTEEYYERAIEYIKNYISKPVFYFFSNDIEWVKDKYGKLDAVYISEEMFDDYKDWYDMYLMSCCKHNIIANSSFSWWGAWLNSNENKIVIAPSKWVNNCEIIDICPKEWVRL